MPEKHIFLDFDNTLSDQYKFYLQYTREIGAILAPTYGGAVEAWAKCGADMLKAIEQSYVSRFLGNPLAGYCVWQEEMQTQAVGWLFEGMGLPLPPNPVQLAQETQFNALTACDATFPGAYTALSTLFENEVRVQMASANASEFLLAALIGAGIESFTESKFGPELVDCAKEGPEFYERIFAATGVSPAETLVVDDHPDSIRYALQTGAKVIQARLSTEKVYGSVPGVTAVLTDLHDLPGLVQQALG